MLTDCTSVTGETVARRAREERLLVTFAPCGCREVLVIAVDGSETRTSACELWGQEAAPKCGRRGRKREG